MKIIIAGVIVLGAIIVLLKILEVKILVKLLVAVGFVEKEKSSN